MGYSVTFHFTTHLVVKYPCLPRIIYMHIFYCLHDFFVSMIIIEIFTFFREEYYDLAGVEDSR